MYPSPTVLGKFGHFSLAHKSLWAISLMLLFVLLFDGILGYTVPVLLTQNGLTKTQLGLVFSFSSVAGAAFDFLLAKFINKVNFRRLFLVMFGVCLVYALLLFKANSLILYLAAMVLWGIYFDLIGFGVFDYVGRFTKKSEHAQSFGIMDVFRSIGNLLAPLIAGFLVIEYVDYKPFALAILFLCIAWVFYVVLLKNTSLALVNPDKFTRSKSLVLEFKIWSKIGRKILPVVVFIVFISCYDAFFWTLGPLISEGLSEVGPFGGLFLTVYFLPSMFMGLFAGKITKRVGQKRTSFYALFLGSTVLMFLGSITNSILLLIVVFTSSVLSAVAWPAIRGAYADYVSEAPNVEAELDGLGDLSANIGYIIGPATAGFLADQVGNLQVFSILGIGGVVLSLILLKLTPRHINIPKKI